MFPPLLAEDLLHLWQQALSATTLVKCNHTSEHLVLSSIVCAQSLHGVVAYESDSERLHRGSKRDFSSVLGIAKTYHRQMS